MVNGNNVSGATSNSYSYTPSQGDVVTCVMTSNQICTNGNPATSNAISMTVNPINTPIVTIEASTNPVCDGSMVSMTATPVNAGLLPTYQWKVNGSNVGTSNPVFMFTPANNDQVQCVVTSGLPCSANPAVSNTVTLTVNPMLGVGVTITASANPICQATVLNSQQHLPM
jgi:hypothetical protein